MIIPPPTPVQQAEVAGFEAGRRGLLVPAPYSVPERLKDHPEAERMCQELNLAWSIGYFDAKERVQKNAWDRFSVFQDLTHGAPAPVA